MMEDLMKRLQERRDATTDVVLMKLLTDAIDALDCLLTTGRQAHNEMYGRSHPARSGTCISCGASPALCRCGVVAVDNT